MDAATPRRRDTAARAAVLQRAGTGATGALGVARSSADAGRTPVAHCPLRFLLSSLYRGGPTTQGRGRGCPSFRCGRGGRWAATCTAVQPSNGTAQYGAMGSGAWAHPAFAVSLLPGFRAPRFAAAVVRRLVEAFHVEHTRRGCAAAGFTTEALPLLVAASRPRFVVAAKRFCYAALCEALRLQAAPLLRAPIAPPRRLSRDTPLDQEDPQQQAKGTQYRTRRIVESIPFRPLASAFQRLLDTHPSPWYNRVRMVYRRLKPRLEILGSTSGTSASL